MRLRLLLSLVTAAYCATALRADVAVSIRYFKTEGTSHYHLYLYGDDGKVIRQLTDPEDAQDTKPMFSADGQEIVFTREIKGRAQTMAIRPDGTNLHEMEKAPEGYPLLMPTGDIYAMAGGGDNDPLWTARGEDLFMTTPDKKQEVVMKADDNFKKKDATFEALCFGALTLRELPGGEETRVVTAGEAADAYCDLSISKKSPFLMLPGMRLLFFWQWQGSDAGQRLGVLDLDAKKTLFLSGNPAFAIRHGTRAGFFCVTEERYKPLGDTGHTVNCLYLDWWDDKLKQTRFASGIGLFGGASARVEGQPQVNIPQHEDD